LKAGVPYYDDKLGQFIDLPKMIAIYNIHANNIVGGHAIFNDNIEMPNPPQNESSDGWSAYLLIFLIIILLIFFYFQLFHDTWEYNYVQKLVDVIDNNKSETKRNLMMFVNGGLGVSLWLMIKSCYRKFSKDKKRKKEKSIRENMVKL
jgi:hypothetical protein